MNFRVFLLLIILPMMGASSVAIADVHRNDSSGMKWQYGYDDAGRITRAVDPAERVTKFSYELDKKSTFSEKQSDSISMAPRWPTNSTVLVAV